ncbi:hypothetical protein GFK26_11270 [Variovorax paradoxus]|uniref:Bacterial Ig-like domain-containing protein n=1 Tax=Variovorax paradoxus TaxID=34073 RepID=A0A5Q0M161_VARPD|nr:Ig-like domain-containing protein [Variovorax paradoxus]QFZ83301.1 hypothetical protein GFK26_11270 [Variovorax paradoxus]
MATKKKTKVVVSSNGKNIDHTVDAAATGKAPLKIKVGKGAKYLLKGEDGFAPENVTLTRVGADLHVTLEGEASPSLVLEGYYAQSEPVGLYGVAEDGQLYAYTATDGASEIFSLTEGRSTPVALGGDSFGSGVSYLAGAEAGTGNDFMGGMLPLLLTGGLVALGIGAIAAASGSDGETAPPSLPPVAPPVVQPPGKPGFDGIGGAHDDVGLVQGPIERGGETDDTRPDFHGTGTPGNTVTVYDNGTELGKVVVDGSGAWKFTPTKDLEDGQHSITITESDAGGRESVPSDPFEFGVDITPPVQPGWNGEGPGQVKDDVGLIQGNVLPGGATDDPRPEFKGEGTPGSTIIVQDKGEEIGQVQVGKDGQWTFTPKDPLSEGDHAITIVERDPVGNESKPSKPFEFDVDTTPPDQPQLGGAIDNMGDIKGPIAPGGVTDDRQPEFHGQGTPGDTIVIKDNGKEIGIADVGEDGNWTFVPSIDLGEGDHSITIVARDPAGNESKPSDPFEFEIDVTPPDASKLALTGVADDVGAVQGNVASGETTDDARPLLSGTSAGTPGHTVVVWVENSTGTHKLGEAIVGEGGKWTLQVDTPLAAGQNKFTVVEHDAAGNGTFPTEPYTVNIDTGRPEVPVIQNIKDDVGVVHMLQKGEVTNDAKPTIIGTAQAGTTVKVYDNGTFLGQVVADAGGNWSFTPVNNLADGKHDITATATNPVGQTSDPTGIWNFSVDATAPGKATDFEVTDDVGGSVGKLTEGMTTDDDRPTFSGKAEPGATVNVYDNGVKIGEAIAGGNGSWTFTPDTPLASGNHAFTTEVVDAAGNSSGQGEPLNVIVDAIPGVVTLDRLVDDQGAVKGTIAANGSTDDTRPEIQGTGKIGSTIKVYDGATLLGQTVVGADGTWRFTPTADLSEGAHAITVTATNLAGNVSDPTPAVNFTIDTITPTAPSIDAVKDDVGAVQGALTNGGTTDDPSPTLSGKAEAGTTVTIKDGSVVLGTVVADKDGNWNYTPTSPLAEGEHTFTVTSTDKAGNTSAPSAEFVVTTDYTPPDASKLSITGVHDDVGGITGNVAPGVTTDDALPAISGTGTAGNTIIVMVKDATGNHKLATAIVGADGKWSLQVTTPLAVGSNEFTAIEQDKAGNQTAPSASYTIVVDTGRPEVPVIQNVQDDAGSVTGMLQKGQVTDDAKPTIIGTAQAGTTVKIYDNGTFLGQVVADATGKWSYTPGANLADGKHDITATATNVVGQTSDATGIWNFSVDTKAPGQVTGLEVLDDVGAVQEPLKSGDTTDDNKPEFNGKAEPGATVNLYDGDTKIGEAVADENGNWSITPTNPLGDGAHSLTTEVVDPAGNSSGKGPALDITVDTSGVTVSIDKLVDDQGAVKGAIVANGTTDDKRPEIQGQGKADSTIKVYDGATLLGETIVKSDGTWSFTPTADLGEGAHAITATATDLAGNVSAATPAVNFTIDTIAPAAPSIDAVKDDVGAVQGALVNGATTDDPSPTLSGKAEAGSTVTVKDGTVVLGTAVADANGNWSYTPTTPLAEGEHKFTVTSTDKAGNTGAPSGEFVVTTDYTAPDASKLAITGVEDDVGLVQGNVAPGAVTDDSRPVISGTGTAGDTIIVMVKDSTGNHKLGEATVGADGKWSLQVSTPLLYGSNEFTAIEVDPAGNPTAPSAPYTVIAAGDPPPAPSIQNVQDDVGASQGMLQKGQVTDDAKPTIIGTAQPGTTVKIYDSGNKIGEVVTDATGKWSFTPETALADGTHNITATATNVVGQTSDATGIWNFSVDTKAPGQVTGLDVLDDVGAVQDPLKSGDTTDDNQPEFKGQAEPGSTVNLYEGDTLLGSAVADENGNWSITPTNPLGDGDHSLSLEVVDPAGNSSGKGPALDITVDTSGVTVSISKLVDDQGAIKGTIAANGSTDDTRPEIQGTGKAGSTIKVYDGGVLLGQTEVKADGTWSFTPTTDLAEGAHAITATATDKAGNTSEPTSVVNFTIDTLAPTAPSIDAVADDVGAKQGALVNGATTDDPTPTLSGKAEAGSTVTVYDKGAKLGTAVADANGNWSYTPTTPLAEGEHTFTVTATDKAGNTGAPSAPFVVTTDYTAPDASKLAITGVEDDVGAVTGNVASGHTTDDVLPLIRGTGTAGDTIIVMVKDSTGNHKLGEATVGADGKWALQVTTPLASGISEFTAIEVDPAGNPTAPSAPYSVILDTVPAPGATIVYVMDDVGAQQGALANGDATDDTRPTLIGSARAGDTVKIYDGATLLGEVVANNDGNWEFTPSVNLAEGAHSFTAVSVDKAGNPSAPSTAFDLTVDQSAPAKPEVGGAIDNVGEVQGDIAPGGVTDDRQPEIHGEGTPGDTIVIKDNGNKIGEVEVGEDGKWTFTPPTDLAEGDHSITIVERDPAGNESQPSDPLEFVVDTTPPSAANLAITGVADDVGGIMGNVASGETTDDARPALSGTSSGAAGNTIIVMVKDATGERELGRATVAADGTWTLQVSTPLASGSNVFTAVEMDLAGNKTAPSAEYAVTVDTGRPEVPVIQNVQDDVGVVHMLQKGEVTDDAKPTIIGTSQAGNTIKVYDGATLLGQVVADATGKWSFTPGTNLADGTHNITATATNVVGQTSDATGIWNFVVDTKAPGAVTGLEVLDDVGAVQDPLKSGDTTDDNKPELKGKAEAGSTVKVYDGATLLGEVVADANGDWSFTPSTPLVDGAHSLTTEVVDPAGNSSGKGPALDITVDTSGVTVSISKLVDDQGAIKGAIAANGSTDDTKPEIQGTGKAGSTIKVYDGATLLGQTEVKADGTWSFTPSTDLAEGAHAITATATDKAGNTSEPTSAVNFTIDTLAPSVPSIDEVKDDVGAKQGALTNGATTDDPTPTLSGKAEAGSTVTVYDNGAKLGTAVADANGNWSYTPTTPLAEGEHKFTVTATDKAGNTGAPSGEFTVTTDYTAPDASKLAITGVEDDVGGVLGNIASGGTTDDSRPLISGTGTAGDTIIVSVKDGTGSREIGRATVDANGSWTLQVESPLLQGSNEFTAVEVDPAGNPTAPSAVYTVTLDSTPPSVPVIQNVQDDAGSVTGMLQKGQVTDDAKPTIIGTSQAGNTIKVYDGATLLGTVVADATGKWSFTPGTDLADGTHNITATATNTVGQTSDATGIWNFVVDTKAPGQVTGLEVLDDVGAVQDPLQSGDTTDDNKPEFKGQAEPGATVNLYDGDTKIGEAVADENGNWSITPTNPLADGDHSLTTEVVDPAGNSSGKGPALDITVDTSGVTVSISKLVDDQGAIKGTIAANGSTDDTRPEIQGTGKAGSTIKVYDGATLLGQTEVKADGTWSFTPTTDLAEGAHAITATATDKAGNTSEPTSAVNFTVDTSAPSVPSIDEVKDDVGAKQGALTNGATTDDPTPTLSGKAEAGSTVTVYDNGAKLGTAVADANGNWSYTPTTPLAEGEHTFTVTATDKAGNTGAPSAEFTVTTDYTAPDASKLAITGVEDDVGGVLGNIASGGTTDDSRPLISGTGTAGDTIIVSVKDATGSREIGRATVDANGNWTLQVSTPLLQGSNEFTAVEVDPAGNPTTPSAPYTVTLDSTPPSVPVIQNVQDDAGSVTGMLQKGQVTDDAKPTIIGTSQAGNTIKVYDGATLLGQTVADATGKWSFTPGTNLADGTHNITATATNTVGQTSDATGIWNFVVDTKAPGAVTGLEVLDDVGAVQDPLKSGDTTDDNKPEFKGQAEPGATVNLYDGDTKIGEAVADENGNWSITPTNPLADGAHALTTEVVDPAGNSSGKGPALDITVDTSGVTVSISKLVDDQGAIKGAIAANGSTDDTRPEIQGTGKAGSTIKVYDGATLLGQTEVKADGTWSFTPTADLAEGAHAITATATDKAGNTSEPTSVVNFTIDTLAPTAPSIDEVKDDVGAKQGALVNGSTTDDPTPTLSGKAEAGSTVTILDNGAKLGTAVADANGNWSYTPTTPLAEGEHTFTVTATDKAGNTGAPSGEFTVTTDYTPPDAGKLAISGVQDDVGAVTGNIASGTGTDDTLPEIRGTGTAGDTIIVMVKDSTGINHELGRATVGADGKWALQVTTPLLPGKNEFTAIEVDPAGNPTAPSAVYEVNLNTVAPNPPTIEGVKDDVGALQGPLPKGDVTDDAQPTLNGTAQAGHTVTVYDGAVVLGTAVADANGKWEFTPAANLADGTHQITATATDPEGLTSAKTAVWDFVVDTVPPTQTAELIDIGKDSGFDADDFLTNDGSAGRLLHGNLSAVLGAGETLQVSTDGGTTWKAAFVDGAKWSAQDDNSHTGDWAVQTRVVDEAGNAGPVESQAMKLDTVAPAAPTKVSVVNGGVEVEFNPADVAVGHKVSLILQGNYFDYTLTPADIAAGRVLITNLPVGLAGSVSAAIADPAGNASQFRTSETEIVMDDFSNPVGKMESQKFLVTSSNMTTSPTLYDTKGSDATDKYGNQATGKALLVNMDGLAGGWSQLTLKNGGVATSAKFNIYGTDFVGNKVEFYDIAGNLIYTQALTAGRESGRVGNDGGDLFDIQMPIGTAFSSIKFIGAHNDGWFVDNVVIGAVQTSVLADLSQSQTLTDASVGTLHGGSDNNVFTVTDVKHLSDSAISGNGGQDTLKLTGANQTLDLTGLGRKVSSIEIVDITGTGNNTLNLSLGDVMENGAVDQFVTNGRVQMLVKGNVGDAVSLTDLLPNGTDPGDWVKGANVTIDGVVYEVYAHSGFKADLLVQQGVTVTLQITIDRVLDDAGAITGAIDKGGFTDDTTPTLQGKAAAGGTVKVYDGSTLVGSAVADAKGNWSFTPTAALSQGLHGLSATVTPVGGSESAKTAVFELTVDSIAPTQTATVTDIGNDSGFSASDFLTNDGHAGREMKGVLSAALAANETLQVSTDGGQTWKAASVAGTQWTLQDGNSHTESWNIQTRVVDAAGNVGPALSQAVTLDQVPPKAPTQLVASGTGVDVYFDATDAKAGDKVRVAFGDKQVDHLLTTADIAAGKVFVANPVPPFTVDFTSVPLESVPSLQVGRLTIDSAGMSVLPGDSFSEALQGTKGNYLQVDMVGGQGPSLGFAVAGGTDYIAFHMAGLANPDPKSLSMTVYDLNGQVIEVVALNLTAPSQLDCAYTAPAGKVIGHVSFETAMPTLWIAMDNIQIGGGVNANTDAKAVIIDPAGNISTETMPMVNATLDKVVDDQGTIKGELQAGALTDDNQPDLSGKAGANSTVVIKDNGVEIGRTTADANGNWALKLPTPLADGAHSLTATALDANGIAGTPTGVFGLTVDATAPTKPTIVSVTDDVGSILGNMGPNTTTDDPRPEFKGKAEAGSTVVIFDKGVEIARVQADAAGNWKYTPATGLTNSTHTITVTAIDKAGNTSATSDAFGFTVLTTPPPKPTIVSVVDDVGAVQGELYSGGRTDDAQPVVTGKAEANSTVIIYDNGVEVTRLQADASGNWTYTPAAPLAEGGHSISAVAMNQAGTTSVPSAAFGFTVDTVAPAAPTIVTVYDDVGTTGNVTNGGTTDDAQPEFKGKAEANSTVVIYDGATEIGRVKASASGDWSFTPTTALINGAHSISAKAVDAAGNVSAPSGGFNFDVTVFDLFEDFNSDAIKTFPNVGDSLDSGVFTITQLKSAISWYDSGVIDSHYDGEHAWGISGGSTKATLNNGVQASAIKFLMRDNQDPIGPTISFYDKSGGLIFSEKFNANPDDKYFEFKMPGGALFSSFVVTPGAAPNHGWDYIELDNISIATATTGEGQFAVDQKIVDRAESEFLTTSDEILIAKLGFADRLEGGAGNDTFTNVGTADVAHGGVGDDTVRIHSGDFERIDGGLGIDTLVMDGKSMHIDLSALGLAKVQGFEKFDLGAGDNTLALSAADVLAGGARDMVTADGKVQMLVNGANGEVDLLGGQAGDDGWMQGSNATVGGVTYSVYTNLAGTAELLVEDKVHVTIL